MKIAVVIPVYRTSDRWEEISLRQCCKVLGQYDHYLVAPDNLDTSVFQSLWSEYGLSLYEERFAPEYFKGISGYNRLCLSREYYARFSRGGVFVYTGLPAGRFHFPRRPGQVVCPGI